MGDNNHEGEMLSAAAGEVSAPPAAAEPRELGATDDQFEELAAELTETLVKRDEEVEELRNEVARLDLVAGARLGEIGRLDRVVASLRAARDEAERKLAERYDTIMRLQGQVEAAVARESELVRRVAELEAELKRAQLGFRETFSRSASAAGGGWY